VREPTDIPTVGRFAILADPQGAVFAAFTPLKNAPGHDGPPKLGEFSWHELMTKDQSKAFDFYADLFGWEQAEAMDMGSEGVYQIYSRNGQMLGGMFNTPKMPPHWCLYIMVDDADRMARQVTEQGGKILNGPMDIPGGGRIAQCMDPQDAVFVLHSNAKTP
jgi:predicted enzyme related to lactoylglutathione lyase